MKGTVDRAEMHYIIRDFDRGSLKRKRKMMRLPKKSVRGCIRTGIELVIEQHYNMRERS